MSQPGSKWVSSGEVESKLFPATNNIKLEIGGRQKWISTRPDGNSSKDEVTDIKESWIDGGEALELCSRQGKEIHPLLSLSSGIHIGGLGNSS